MINRDLATRSFCLALSGMSAVANSRVRADEADPTLLTLERIITADEFRTKSFGPARWLKDGTGYTTLEPAEGGHGRDLVQYDPADGRRQILVAASKLRPAADREPLAIEDYAWSDDGSKLLIFTNTRRVWRRGRVWVRAGARGLVEDRAVGSGGDRG